MNKQELAIAKEIYDVLCIPSDCCDEKGNLKEFDYVVAIDDDVTSAIYAVNMARQIKKIHGEYPTILCVGGKGILSRHLYNKSEAEVLADVCLRLGYPKNLVWYEGFETGKNAAENIQNVAEFIKCLYKPRSVLFCVTKRQSLWYAVMQQEQAPYLDVSWCVINETFEEACKLMNAKSLCDGEMMLHEVAAIMPLCQRYVEEKQKRIPFLPPEACDVFVMGKAAYLAKKYCLKIGGRPRYRLDNWYFDGSYCLGIGKFRFTDYCRYVRLYISLLRNRKKIMKAIDNAVIMDNLDYGMTNANLAV